jgi:glycosyltransferase involved in cell wall biosynthesis
VKLSIIIAAYNVEKFIEKCIYSCVHQNFDKSLYEIVVVNDGSKDNTTKILNKLETKIENLHTIYQENSGLGASRNIGLKNALGDYVWFIDGDDYIENNCLEAMLKLLTEEQSDVLVLNYTVG